MTNSYTIVYFVQNKIGHFNSMLKFLVILSTLGSFVFYLNFDVSNFDHNSKTKLNFKKFLEPSTCTISVKLSIIREITWKDQSTNDSTISNRRQCMNKSLVKYASDPLNLHSVLVFFSKIYSHYCNSRNNIRKISI